MATEHDTVKEKESVDVENVDKASDIDRGHAWVVLAATYASFFVAGSFILTSGIVHTALLVKFRQSVAKTSWAGSVFLAIISLTSPIGSAIVDRYSCRLAVMVGSTMVTAGFIMTGWAPNVEFSPIGSAIVDRYSCRVAVMVGSTMVTAGFIMTGWAPNVEFCIFSFGFVTATGGGILFAVLFVVNGFNFKERLNLAQGITLSGTGLGLFILAPVFETSKVHFGYTGLFFVMAALAMQMAVFGALMRPSSVELKVKTLRNCGQKRQHQSFTGKLRYQFDIYGKALCRAYICLISFSMFFYCGGIYAMFLHWPNFCLQRGFSPMQSSYALSIVGLLSIGGRFVSGVIASLRYVSERMVYSGSLMILGSSLILFFLYSKTFPGHIVLAVMVGLLNGSVYVVITSLTARGCGLQFLSAAVGIEFMFGGIGSVALPLISGYMIQGGFTYETVFAACGLCLVIAAALCFGTKFVEESAVAVQETKTLVVGTTPEEEALVVKHLEKNDFELKVPQENVQMKHVST